MQGVILDPFSLALTAVLVGLLIAARLTAVQHARQARRGRGTPTAPAVQIREVHRSPDDIPVYLRFTTPTRLPRLQADQFSV